MIILTFLFSQTAFGTLPENLNFPKKLNCDSVEGQFSDQVLYTRLDRIKTRSQLDSAATEGITLWPKNENERPRGDEVAFGWRGDYFQTDVSVQSFRYIVWTCDSEDREYLFQTADLALPADSKLNSKNVDGRLIVSIREDVQKFDLNCIAEYE